MSKFYFNAQGKVFSSLDEVSQAVGQEVKNKKQMDKHNIESIEADSLKEAQGIVKEMLDLLGVDIDIAAGSSDDSVPNEEPANEIAATTAVEERKPVEKAKAVKKASPKKAAKQPEKPVFEGFKVPENAEGLASLLRTTTTEQMFAWAEQLGIDFSSTGRDNVDRMLLSKKFKARFFPRPKKSRKLSPWSAFNVKELAAIAKKNNVSYMKVSHVGIQQMRLIEALNKAGIPIPTK